MHGIINIKFGIWPAPDFHHEHDLALLLFLTTLDHGQVFKISITYPCRYVTALSWILRTSEEAALCADISQVLHNTPHHIGMHHTQRQSVNPQSSS